VAVGENETSEFDDTASAVRLTSFAINGLFGYLDHRIDFPQMDVLASEPEVVIVEGQNGSGKTTIMKMIAGALDLDFDTFRAVPFRTAELNFSNGQSLGIRHQPENVDFKIRVTFGDYAADLASIKEDAKYTRVIRDQIDRFRHEARKILRSIDYDFLSIERSGNGLEARDARYMGSPSQYYSLSNVGAPKKPPVALSRKVADFLRDAQVNYRRFFQAEDLELLPRMLSRFERSDSTFRHDDMVLRLERLYAKNDLVKSFGLQSSDAELAVLSQLLGNDHYKNDLRALTLIDSYLEMHENISKIRQLIADRLVEFEKIMDEFLVGKSVKVNARHGLVISSAFGPLKETDLSSGEYHFLYMMVSALLCQRAGTILAIDEPELSLHIKWQRNLVKALSRCARGASPIFFLATHSTAISAQYAHKVQRLSAVD
jgi:ABC-type hemin transport system ATPase subunit